MNLIVSSIKEKKILIVASLFFILFALLISPIEAHHPWDTQKETFNIFQGFLSGLAHPILGIDHFLFLISIGLIRRSFAHLKVTLLLAFGLSGAIASQFAPIFPGSELVMGLSIVFASLVAFSKFPPVVMLGLIFCHGFVLGNSMIGVEPTPLMSYFIGLSLIELLLIIFGDYVFIRFLKYRRLFSLILLGAGLTLSINTLFQTL